MRLILLIAALLSQCPAVLAEPVPVGFREGSVHGFLAVRSLDGKIIASGDLVQVVKGDKVTSHLTFRFRDGSVDEETAVFSQRTNFELVTDHHVQKGPSFPHPIDVLITRASGTVLTRVSDAQGGIKEETTQLELPSDLANGVILYLLKNIRRESVETKVAYLAPTSKPRLVKLSIKPRGEEAFSIAGHRMKATRYVVKVELGGVTGAVAPLVGKQPDDINVWILGGPAPAFVKLEGPLYADGPIWRVEMASPLWQSRDSAH